MVIFLYVCKIAIKDKAQRMKSCLFAKEKRNTCKRRYPDLCSSWKYTPWPFLSQFWNMSLSNPSNVSLSGEMTLCKCICMNYMFLFPQSGAGSFNTRWDNSRSCHLYVVINLWLPTLQKWNYCTYEETSKNFLNPLSITGRCGIYQSVFERELLIG